MEQRSFSQTIREHLDTCKPAVILRHTSQPTPVLSDPREQEVRHQNADVCSVCKVATKYHWAISGRWVGCEDARKMQQPQRNPERWNDPRPAVTAAVRRALETQCGPALAEFLGTFTHDEVLAVACEAGRAAVEAYAYTRSLGK